MPLSDDISRRISDILNNDWNISEGIRVPSDNDISMTGKSVRLQGTVLYADLKESSKLVDEVSQRMAAKIYQSFLNSVARLITENNGTVTAYDGDRIMGIFLGNSKDSNAAICALKVNYVVTELLRPTLRRHFESIKKLGFDIDHCTGIDNSSFLAVKAGQRNANDIVWIGKAPNLAAKLSGTRRAGYSTFITKEVFEKLSDEAKYGGNDKRPMWEKILFQFVGDDIDIYGSKWYWPV